MSSRHMLLTGGAGQIGSMLAGALRDIRVSFAQVRRVRDLEPEIGVEAGGREVDNARFIAQ